MQLSDFILKNMGPILTEWREFAITTPGGASLDVESLEDHAREILETIAKDMAVAETPEQQERKSKGEAAVNRQSLNYAGKHAAERLLQKFDLNQVISEYRAIRASVIRLWMVKMNHADSETLYQLIRFNEAIDQALTYAIVEYTKQADQSHEATIQKLQESEEHQRSHIKKLQEYDKRKDEFLAMLSHELRNPLAPIFSGLELLRQEDESEIQREVHGVIGRQAKHLSRLVNDLLEVSRITTGRIKLRIQDVELNTVIERSVERVRPEIYRREQELVLSLPDEPIRLKADAMRLEQVIGNILHNASKFNRGGGCIWLSAEQSDEQVTIRIRDNGTGITPELLPNIFELFTQADRGLDRTDCGLGIGLKLAKSLVELHHGKLDVNSEGVGYGSEFIIRMPSSIEFPQEPEAFVKHDETDLHLRILIVDDHVDTAKMSEMMLKSWGHDIRVAHNGQDALKRAKGFKPHVIFLDIGMPGMDGYEVARTIRQTPDLESSLLVAITGYGHDVDRRRSRLSGIDIHLTKPVEPSYLKQILSEFTQPKNKP